MSRFHATAAAALAAALAILAAACAPAPPPWTSESPSGFLDEVTVVGGGKVTLRGWAGDRDTNAPITVVFFTEGTAIGTATSNQARPDVVSATKRQGRFGFTATIAATAVKPGTRVCASAVNVGPGEHSLIGCRKATGATRPTPTVPPGPAPTTSTTTTLPDEPVLDQAFEPNGSLINGFACPDNSVVAQTFTAGRTGNLERIDLAVQGDVNLPVRLRVELRATSSGQITTTVLAVADIDQVPASSADWLSATFADPAAVTTGQQYAYVVSVPANCTQGPSLRGTLSGAYPGGSAWSLGFPNPNMRSNDDWGFRTYVS